MPSADASWDTCWTAECLTLPSDKSATHCSGGATCSITSEGMRALTASCPGLQVVDLTRCAAMTNEGVLALAHGCSSLEVLSLWGCSSVGDAALLALASREPRLQMRKLQLTQCRNLTDKAVRAVLTNCLNVRLFTFDRCPLIT
ncbi:unnamed protein product, partial [Coregonus sp. 'balchen']